MRAARGLPEHRPEPVARLALLEEGVVLEDQAARLQVGLAGAGLDRNQLVVDHLEQHPVDVGQLHARGIDPVVVGVALGDEALGRRPRHDHPGLQRRQVGIVELVHVVLAPVELGPVARPVRRDQASELVRVGVFLVELLQVVGGRVDEQRVRGGQRRQEERVGLRPAVADGLRAQDLDLRQLALDHELARRPERAELEVGRHVLPPVAEVLGREGRPVRPAVARPEVESEGAPGLDVDRLGDVGHELEIAVVADQTRIAVDHEQARLAAAADQHPQIATPLAERCDLGHAGLERRSGLRRRGLRKRHCRRAGQERRGGREARDQERQQAARHRPSRPGPCSVHASSLSRLRPADQLLAQLWPGRTIARRAWKPAPDAASSGACHQAGRLA
jgi:hypothetical protein